MTGALHVTSNSNASTSKLMTISSAPNALPSSVSALLCDLCFASCISVCLRCLIMCVYAQVSVINLIMATGLSVDYSVYFAQKFMTTRADGTGNGRMTRALADTGFAVFLGGFTALLGKQRRFASAC